MPKTNGKVLAQRITDHEKLCRIMQKQTQNQIIKLQKQIDRLEKVIISAAGVIIIGLFAVVFALLKLHVW
tara:strand:- start:308 stop:517 length:210 start_codon:yes stop_codon:yes gene_type:complete